MAGSSKNNVIKWMLSVAGCLCIGTARAASDLASMDLEQLMDMNVTTVSKREQTLSSAAAAIYTISQEDIRRSAATSLPEILQQAPGMEVARINPSMWAVTARGFNSQFANKLLVLIDGRSIYTPLFSGIYWDAQMPPLDDIQRIEVIRGPGASLWGSNAVNGVINIITYDSEQTIGSRHAVGVGNEEQGFVRSRHGFKQGNLSGRVNAQYRKVDNAVLAEGRGEAHDGYQATQAGARFDWRPSIAEKGTFELGATQTDKLADIYVPEELLPLVDPRTNIGAHTWHALASWLHELGNGDALFLQTYTDYDHRVDPLNTSERLSLDYELQFNHRETEQHRVTWGVTHRTTLDNLQGSFIVFVDDPKQNYSLNTAFLQDEYRVTDAVRITLGIKLEDSNSDPIERQPSLRIAWQPDENTTWWAAASRAARTPSRLESSLEYRTSAIGYLKERLSENYPWLTGYTLIRGSEEFDSEILNAYEVGWRWQANDKLLLDITTYINDYDRLLTYRLPQESESVDYRYYEQAYIGVIGLTKNVSHGKANGLEIAADYVVSSHWKLKSSYSYFNFDSSHNPADMTTPAQGFERQSPEHQLQLMSYHTLPNQWEFDWNLRRVAEILEGTIPAYTDLNLRLGKNLNENLSVSIAGKNLLDKSRAEFIDANYGPLLTELERSVFLQVDWRE